MSDFKLQSVQPDHFAAPKGYANGMMGEGRTLHVGGQIGWDATQKIHTDDFAEQFGIALQNVVDVVEKAGGHAECIASMTIFVTDLDAYRNSTSALSPLWKSRMGRHYPAMALVGVQGLVEPRALVEIQAVALLPSLQADKQA